MTTAQTIPAEWDIHALKTARNLASIDRSRLPGSTTQFVAILQEAILAGMRFATDDRAEKGPDVAVIVSVNFIRTAGVNVSDDEMRVLRAIADRMKANNDTRALQC